MVEETPLQKAIREAKEKTTQKAKDSNPYADMDYETYLKKKSQKVSTQEPANGSQTSGTQSPTSQPESSGGHPYNPFGGKPLSDYKTQEVDQTIQPNQEQENSDPFNLGPIKLGNGSKSDIGYREGGIGGSFKDNINGNYASPLEKVQSERLKEIQEAYEGDQEQIAKAQQSPFNQDQINQGFGDPNKQETSYKNIFGHIAGEAGKTVLGDAANASEMLAKSIANNNTGLEPLSSIEYIKKIATESNPFISLGNLFSATKSSLTKGDSEIESLPQEFFSRIMGVVSGINNSGPIGAASKSFDNVIAGMSPEQRQKSIEDIYNAKIYLDSKTKSINDWQSENPVEKNIFTSTLKGIGGFLPDLALAALTNGGSGEVTAAKYASMFAEKNMPKVIAKYAPKAAAFLEEATKSSLTRVFAVKGALKGGAESNGSVTEGALKGGAEGYATGVYMHGLGVIAGKVSPLISKGVSKTGLTSEYASLIAHPLANASVFAGAKAVSTPILEGRLATKDELYHEIGMGIGMSALSMKSIFDSQSKANKSASELLKTDPIVGLKDVLRSKKEDLLSDFDPFIDVANLQKARDEIKLAILKEPDLKVKQELIDKGLELQKKIDVRTALNEILTNKSELIETFENTKSLTPEQKAIVIERINQIHKDFIEAENNAKKAELSNKVTEAKDNTEVLADRLVNATTPEEIAVIQNEAEATTNQGINAANELSNQVKNQPVSEVSTPEPQDVIQSTYEVGDMLPSTTEDTQTFVKELLPDNKAVVGIVESGIYREETIDLPNEVANAEPNQETQSNIEPAPIVGTESVNMPEAKVESTASEEIVQPEIADSGVPSGSLSADTYKSNSKIYKIGTEQEYNNYVESIFPNSKIKVPIYRAFGNNQYKLINKAVGEPNGGIYVTADKNYVETFAKAYKVPVSPLLVDVKNVKNIFLNHKESKRQNENIVAGKKLEISKLTKVDIDNLKSLGYDAVNLISEPFGDSPQTENQELVLFDKNQIHVLGSKEDIEGFNKFVSSKKEKPAVDLDAQKPKPKKYNKNSRTAKQIDRDPNSFFDAVNQFFIGEGKLSTEDFIAHTGFGFYKESNGKKTKLNPVETDEYLNKGSLQSGEKVTTSKELRLAKFTGKVADRKAGGIDADMILQSYIPEVFSGDQGMDGVTNIVNAAANKTKGEMLKELEASDAKIQENGNEANFGYTDAEIAEMEVLSKAIDENEYAFSDEELNSLIDIQSSNVLELINDEISNEVITENDANIIRNLTDKYTDEQGIIDWNSLENDYYNSIYSNSDVNFDILVAEPILKKIFEDGNTKIKEQTERSKQRKDGSVNSSSQSDSKNVTGESKGVERGNESEARGTEIKPEISNGSTSKELGSSDGIYSGIEEISNAIERSIKTAKQEQQGQMTKNEIEDLEKRLTFDFAKKNKLWIKDFYDLGSPFIGGGNENTLAYDEANGIIYKSNNLFNSKNSIISLLEQIANHNAIFPNTRYEIVGFTGIDNGTKRVPYIEPILKQEYISDAVQASQIEIDDYMSSLGFEKVNNHAFKNPEYKISDLYPRNVLKDPKGNIYVVDDIVTKNKKGINESLQEPNTTSNGEVQTKSEQGNEQGEGNDIQSTTDTRASEGKAKIEKAKQVVDENQSNVIKLQNEVNKLSEKLAKNLKENQANMFGNNKTQSIFDDKADQQKIFNDKLLELREAQESLVKAKQELADLRETEGQVELAMPESKVEIDGEVVDLSETTPKEDADIIVKSTLNPFKLISFAQKGVDKLENNTTAALIPKITDMLAETLQAWRTSKNTIKEVTSSVASSIFGGIARTDKDINVKLGLIGGKNMAVYNMGKLMKGLYGIIDNNTESLERIHVVMDPDFYQQGLGGQSNALNPNVPPNLTYNNLTAEEKMLHDELRKNLDEIHFKNYALGFIDVDTFNKHKGTYVPRMYETNELPAETQEILDAYNKQVGTKLNLNPFKKRKDLDQLSDDSKNAILKDPVYLTAKRMMELDTNSAIQNYINHVNRNNKNLVYEGPDKDRPHQFVKLEGKAYGALNGKYVAGFIAEDLKGYFFVHKGLNTFYDGIKMYDRTGARQFVKKGLTVFNPFVQLGNFTSNVVFAQLCGVDFVRWFGNSPSAIKELLAKGKDYETLLGAGLIGTDVVTNDLTPNTTRSNSLLQQKKDKEKGGLFKRLTSPFAKASDKATQLYSGNDDYAKVNAFQIYKEQGYTEAEALKKVYDAFQNYATVGKFWDVAAKTPVFGPVFVKFAADLMRITGNAVAKKPLSSALYLAGLMLIPQILKSIGASEEEEELKKDLRTNRPFIPKMELGFIDIPLVYKTKIGEINLARYITPYYFFDSGDDGKDGILPGMLDRFNPYQDVRAQGYGKGNESKRPFGQDPVLGTLFNIMMDTDFRGKSIQDPQATRFRASGVTDQEKWMNRGTHALRTWIPNGALMHDTYLNAKYGSDSYGRTRTMAQTLINFAIKIQDYKESDYKKTAEKQVFSITNDLRSQVETIKNTYVTDARERQAKRKSLADGSLSKEDYERSIKKLDDRLKDRIEKAYEKKADIDKKLNDFTTKYKRILDE